MTAPHIAVGFVILSLAATAHAQPFIFANQVDDFGATPQTAANQTQTVRVPGHASAIPANYVDDFGSLAGADGAPTVTRTVHASMIPSNYVDEFGTDATVPTATPIPAEQLAARR